MPIGRLGTVAIELRHKLREIIAQRVQPDSEVDDIHPPHADLRLRPLQALCKLCKLCLAHLYLNAFGAQQLELLLVFTCVEGLLHGLVKGQVRWHSTYLQAEVIRFEPDGELLITKRAQDLRPQSFLIADRIEVVDQNNPGIITY